MIPQVYIGYDPRQPIAFNVCAHSIYRHASKPVSVIPLMLRQLPIQRRGLTDFTYSRFLVPYLSAYAGSSIFMDADIVVTGDIHELFEQAKPSEFAVQVMQDQARFEWASVMLFNNACCRVLTPEFIDDKANGLLDFAWARGRVGSFTKEWNHCVGYADPTEAKLYHFTQGIPVWPETAGLPEDTVWHSEHAEANKSVSWDELMGGSVHAKHTISRQIVALDQKLRKQGR